MQKQSQSHTLPPQQLAAKVREYEQFANDVLKADLQKAVEQRAKAQAEIEELEQLRRNVQQLQEQRNKAAAADTTPTQTAKQQQHHNTQMKSQVDLGSGVFCRAVVPDTSHIFISIGLGFHLQVTLEEAGGVIDTQQQVLRARVEGCVDKAARIKAHLKFVAEAIRELTGMP